MKSLQLFLVLMVSGLSVIAQEKNIETLSVSIENLIPFIVENYSTSEEDDELAYKNITFLIQTSSDNLNSEDSVIFKYAFRLLSERLSENDRISIVTYSGLNGIAMHPTSPKEIKIILHTIDNLKISIKEFFPDGIALAYAQARENFDDEAQNTVVMIRNPNVGLTTINTENLAEESAKPTKKNNTLLITAIALLPEIISVIKD